MKSFLPSLLALTLAFATCQSPQSETDQNQSTVLADSLFEAFFEFKMRINPIEATKGGDNRYNDLVANFISDPYLQGLLDQYIGFLDAIATVELETLDLSRQLSLKVMQWDCQMKLEGLKNRIVTIASPMFDLPNFELMPITQIASLHLYFSQLAGGRSIQPFQTVEDYENWLKRVGDYLVWVDTCMVKMEQGIEQGVVLPKVLIERVIGQVESFINPPVEEHVFYAPIGLMPESFSSQEQSDLSAAYREMITDKLVPKYRELHNFLRFKYILAGRETSGLGALPGGKETYDYLVQLHTSTDMPADEIFELGKQEVERIEQEMEQVKAQIGYEGDLKSFLDHVRNSKEQMPFTEPEQVIRNFNAIHEKMKGQLTKLFNVVPKAGFEVRRTEAFREKSGSAEYVPGTKDGSRPGVFYVPIPDASAYNKLQDEALFLHEAIPGHHYQLSLQQENENLPQFLHAEGMAVFVEGWALYAESLGKELGLYDDPYQYFGMLSMEMHRAIRLVVDVGLHAKGWTREEAIQYSLDHEAESEASIVAEIERYMAAPGQALSYKIGQLKIKELRERAEEVLGESFDIREFHNQVLNSGSLPLHLLEEKIDGWIKEQQAA